jgi:hypothetical protein
MNEMHNVDHPVSEPVHEMALELMQEQHIQPLAAGEQRPDGYYSVGHYTGK